ncbi:hypothetical protein MRX96_038822 [Rhipicephalus microplus]
MNRSASCYSPRETRHLFYISVFTTTFIHVKSTNEIPGDLLSHVDAVSTPSAQPFIIDVGLPAAHQHGDTKQPCLLRSNVAIGHSNMRRNRRSATEFRNAASLRHTLNISVYWSFGRSSDFPLL